MEAQMPKNRGFKRVIFVEENILMFVKIINACILLIFRYMQFLSPPCPPAFVPLQGGGKWRAGERRTKDRKGEN